MPTWTLAAGFVLVALLSIALRQAAHRLALQPSRRGRWLLWLGRGALLVAFLVLAGLAAQQLGGFTGNSCVPQPGPLGTDC